jgi:hypothetical protein
VAIGAEPTGLVFAESGFGRADSGSAGLRLSHVSKPVAFSARPPRAGLRVASDVSPQTSLAGPRPKEVTLRPKEGLSETKEVTLRPKEGLSETKEVTLRPKEGLSETKEVWLRPKGFAQEGPLSRQRAFLPRNAHSYTLSVYEVAGRYRRMVLASRSDHALPRELACPVGIDDWLVLQPLLAPAGRSAGRVFHCKRPTNEPRKCDGSGG